MRDLIIIGGGPAAAVAAVYALGKQLDFLVIYETLGKAATAAGSSAGRVWLWEWQVSPKIADLLGEWACEEQADQWLAVPGFRPVGARRVLAERA